MNEVRSNRKEWTFTIVENDVLDTEELDIYQKMTYIALCKFADKRNSRSFPSVATLAKIVGASDRKITNVLKELVDKKFITIEYRNQKTSVYTLLELPFMVNAVQVGGERGSGRVVNTVRVGGEQRSDELESFNENHSNENNNISESDSLNIQFDEWWNLYNKKKDKPKAKSLFNKIIKNHGFDILITKTKEYNSTFGTDDTYKKYPTTFLNGFDPDNDYSNKKKPTTHPTFEKPVESESFVYSEEQRLEMLRKAGLLDRGVDSGE